MSNYTKRFLKAIFVRAIKTVCQAAIAGIGTAAVMGDVDLVYVLSSSAVAGIVSVLTSVATGLPEVKMPVPEEDK